MISKQLKEKMKRYAKVKLLANKLLLEILTELEEKIGEENIEKMRGLRKHNYQFNFSEPLTEFENQEGEGVDTDLIIQDIDKVLNDRR